VISEKYYLQKFDGSRGTLAPGFSPPDDGQMKEWLGILQKYIPAAKIRGEG